MGDAGFSFVEIVVAMGIFALVATFMAQTLGSGLRGVLQGKRREVATQVANEVLEKARSLSFNAIGHIQPLQPDPAIEASIYNGEPLVTVPNVPNHPFDPHIEQLERGSTSLVRYIYVTWATDNPGLKRLTVRVVWDDTGAQGGQNEVRAETLVNASGLIPTGRGGPPLTGSTFASGGFLNVQSSLLGLPVDGLNIVLPTSTGGSTFRGVQNTTCTTRSTSVEAAGLVDLPGYSVTATADDDPRTAVPSQSSAQEGGLLSLPTGPVANLIGPVLNSPVSCDSDATSLAVQQGQGSVAEVLNAQAGITALLGYLNWTLQLARVETLPVAQTIEHHMLNDKRELYTAAQGGIGSVNLLRIPGVIADGLVRIDAVTYGASVRAAEGTPSQPPTVNAPSINLRVFDNQNQLGSTCQNVAAAGVTASRSGSYCLITVSPSATGFNGLTIPLQGSLAHTLSLNSSQLLQLLFAGLLSALVNPVVGFTYDVNIEVLPPASVPPEGIEGPNGERRWSAEYSPVTATATLQATLLGNPLIGASASLDLGSVRAEACSGATCS